MVCISTTPQHGTIDLTGDDSDDEPKQKRGRPNAALALSQPPASSSPPYAVVTPAQQHGAAATEARAEPRFVKVRTTAIFVLSYKPADTVRLFVLLQHVVISGRVPAVLKEQCIPSWGAWAELLEPAGIKLSQAVTRDTELFVVADDNAPKTEAQRKFEHRWKNKGPSAEPPPVIGFLDFAQQLKDRGVSTPLNGLEQPAPVPPAHATPSASRVPGAAPRTPMGQPGPLPQTQTPQMRPFRGHQQVGFMPSGFQPAWGGGVSAMMAPSFILQHPSIMPMTLPSFLAQQQPIVPVFITSDMASRYLAVHPHCTSCGALRNVRLNSTGQASIKCLNSTRSGGTCAGGAVSAEAIAQWNSSG
jgi:hypothetical protein